MRSSNMRAFAVEELQAHDRLLGRGDQEARQVRALQRLQVKPLDERQLRREVFGLGILGLGILYELVLTLAGDFLLALRCHS